MKFVFSDFVNQFEAGIFAILDEKKEGLVKAGRKVYNMSIGTPDFKPAPHVMEAMANACKDPENYKYSIKELPELLEAVKYRYRTRYHVELADEEILAVYGTQEGMAHMGMIFCDPGDTILIPNPGYPLFEMCGIMARANIEYYKIEEKNGYLPDLDSISPEVLKKAKFMIVSYPLNPVCVCADDDFYERLIAFAKKNDIVIIHDNAYSDIIYTVKQGKSFLEYEGAKDVGVEFYSLSKSYNLTGARMSFFVGNKAIVEKLRILRSQIDYGIFLPVQYAAIAALTGPQDFVEEQRLEYERRNHALCDGLTAIGWKVPRSKGTMFVWAHIPEGFDSSLEFCLTLMDKAGIIVTPGSAFGSEGEGYIRMALVKPVAEIEEMIRVLDESGLLQSES